MSLNFSDHYVLLVDDIWNLKSFISTYFSWLSKQFQIGFTTQFNFISDDLATTLAIYIKYKTSDWIRTVKGTIQLQNYTGRRETPYLRSHQTWWEVGGSLAWGAKGTPKKQLPIKEEVFRHGKQLPIKKEVFRHGKICPNSALTLDSGKSNLLY